MSACTTRETLWKILDLFEGLAAVLSDRMCEHILEVGKKPVWAHSSSNLGSMKTALKCGFVQDKINTVIRKNDSGG